MQILRSRQLIRFLFVVLVLHITGCCTQSTPIEKASQLYLTGDYKSAANLLLPEAEKGNPEAQVNIAFMYYCGLHLPKDHQEAAKWYLKSAKQNNVNAQFSLGTLYENAEGVARNYEEAWFWYSLAEQQGDEDAKRLRIRIEPHLPDNALQRVKIKLKDHH